MKKRKTTTRIVLDLEDDEFLELGAMAYSVDTWKPGVAESNAFGRMLLKLKPKIEQKATEGQRDHLEKVVFAIQEAARANPDNVSDLKENFGEFISDAEQVLEVLNQ